MDSQQLAFLATGGGEATGIAPRAVCKPIANLGFRVCSPEKGAPALRAKTNAHPVVQLQCRLMPYLNGDGKSLSTNDIGGPATLAPDKANVPPAGERREYFGGLTNLTARPY